MSVYDLNSRRLGEALIYFFNMKKSAAEAHQILSDAYVRPLWLKERVVSNFNSSKTTTKTGIAVEDEELDTLLDADWADKIIGSNSKCNFKIPQRLVNDPQASILGSTRVES